MKSSIDELAALARAEAAGGGVPVDVEVYRACGKDPAEPVLFGGNPAGRVCFLARDLGKDEVACGEPLIGAAGTLVRGGVHRALFGREPAGDDDLGRAAAHVLLANTVPYKPVGNRAFSAVVRERFRPAVEGLIAGHFAGSRLVSLGNEAFAWFRPYLGDEAADDFWGREDRYEAEVAVAIGGRTFTLAPLPHPSPLNARWYARFPELLAARLAGVWD